MRINRAGWALAVAISCATPSARAQNPADAQAAPTVQQGGENPFAVPELRMYWNPVVGEGAIYEVTSADGKKRTEEYDILSEETIGGMKAFWLEESISIPSITGTAYEKSLVIAAELRARKVISKLPGMAAMEMPAGAPIPTPKLDPKNAPKIAGTESITVPGGTFLCEHWVDPDGSEAWVSAKVGPMKVVKSVAPNKETRVLVKTTSHTKDAITGPVKPYDPEAIKKFIEASSH